MSARNIIWRILRKTPGLVVVLIVFVLGYQFRSAVTRLAPAPPAADAPTGDDDAADAPRVPETWTCSMHPQIRLPAPGTCPICGMDLIRASTPDARPPAKATSHPVKRPPKYACAMFCVPPLSKPGKCPVCGMEMVEVEITGSDTAPPRSLSLSPAAEQLAQIRVAPVERKFVSTEIRMVGKIDYDESRLRYITAWVPGRLERLYVDYTGVPVQKGEHLVYLYSPQLATAQAELIEARKRADDARPMETSLVNQRAGEWLEDVREKFRLWGMTEAQIAEIEQRGTASEYMTIYAPTGGIVIEKNAIEGMYVQTGTRIYTIADLSRVWVILDAYESDLTWLRYGQQVEFISEAYPGETFSGQIAFIDPVLNDHTRTVNLRVNVDNTDGRLKPGMFVRAVVRAQVAAGGRVMDADLAGKWICSMHPEVIEDQSGTCSACGMPLVRTESLGFVAVEPEAAVAPLVIPTSAPLITGKRAVVYVALPDQPGVYQGREVVLGPRAGDFYIVRSGLTEGEWVVAAGAFKIDSAMQIQAEPSMMNPATEAASGPDSPAPAHAKPTASAAPHADLADADPTTIELPAPAARQLTALYADYLRIQGALSKDTLPEARAAAGDLAQQLATTTERLSAGVAREAWAQEQPGIRSSVTALAQAEQLADARIQFALLSESMIAVARRLGVGRQALHRVHCPMAFDNRGADWLQIGKRVENPYFGAAMFRCGKVVARYGPTDADPGDEGSANRAANPEGDHD